MLWEMSALEWTLSFAFMSGMSYITGWFCDRIMSTAGFGHVGNWVVILSGVYAGMFVYNFYGHDLEAYPQQTLAVILGSAFLALFFMSSLKRIFSN